MNAGILLLNNIREVFPSAVTLDGKDIIVFGNGVVKEFSKIFLKYRLSPPKELDGNLELTLRFTPFNNYAESKSFFAEQGYSYGPIVFSRNHNDDVLLTAKEAITRNLARGIGYQVRHACLDSEIWRIATIIGDGDASRGIQIALLTPDEVKLGTIGLVRSRTPKCTHVYLLSEAWEIANNLGNNNVSEGITKAINSIGKYLSLRNGVSSYT